MYDADSWFEEILQYFQGSGVLPTSACCSCGMYVHA